MACVSKYRRLHSTSLLQHSQKLSVFCTLRQKWLKTENEMMIMISSYNVSQYGLVFFLSVSGFYQPHDVTFFELLAKGFTPRPHRGSAPGPRWGTCVTQTLCQCPSQTKILDPSLTVPQQPQQ